MDMMELQHVSDALERAIQALKALGDTYAWYTVGQLGAAKSLVDATILTYGIYEMPESDEQLELPLDSSSL